MWLILTCLWSFTAGLLVGYEVTVSVNRSHLQLSYEVHLSCWSLPIVADPSRSVAIMSLSKPI